MTPFLLIPGLNSDARVYEHAIKAFWPFGPVTIANHLEGQGMAGIAAAILAVAPPKFALGGFSMGGYLAFEVLRQAPERVLKLALIDTNARPDTAESTEMRRRRIEQTKAGKFGLVIEQSFATSVHKDNVSDSGLYALHRAMAEVTGAEAYMRHQEAIVGRPDSRPMLGSITVPTLVVIGEGDQLIPMDAAEELHEGIAGSTLAVVAAAGHLALLENVPAVNNALAEWAAA